jgi:hypothetical protein
MVTPEPGSAFRSFPKPIAAPPETLGGDPAKGTEITIPVCGWVDGNTGASIAEITADTVTKKPAQVDLAAAAETAVKIRDEIRKPIG